MDQKLNQCKQDRTNWLQRRPRHSRSSGEDEVRGACRSRRRHRSATVTRRLAPGGEVGTAPNTGNPTLFINDPSAFLKGRLVHFQFYHPTARFISVKGRFGGDKAREVPLRHLGGGAWVVSLLLPPGRYEYQYVADGQWKADPLATDYTEGPGGSLNSVTVVE